ncbi:hypothetical protein [Streptococcus equinus]|uniref:Uncharacterized protein n=1 Tax=Streptococcus equinus TaxID=1335 RepID=A0AAE8HJP3_STREI|nr:hypothetical protein [Streptococcus equinus]SDW31926.1 hypothetical protein SAMN05216415_0456 [Streptococcus equinus]SEP59094.1 hypothetical protein SAMN05216346_101161 [Streptococcus equinus]
MADTWELLDQKERALLKKIDDLADRQYQAEQLFSDFEAYDEATYDSENNLWEAAYQSRFSHQLESLNERRRCHKERLVDDFLRYRDDLKREESHLEREIEVIRAQKHKEK